LHANPSLAPEDLASVFFTLTDDLSAAYPAQAARQLGWVDVPLLCAREINVSHALPRIIRVLLHWNTDLPQSAIRHVYLDRAIALRPDLAQIKKQSPDQNDDHTGQLPSIKPDTSFP
jgi:chorismate mutase